MTGTRGRVAFAVAAIVPLVILQGVPGAAPGWFVDRLAGVPIVVWLAAAWFAMLVVATWVPTGEGDGA